MGFEYVPGAGDDDELWARVGGRSWHAALTTGTEAGPIPLGTDDTSSGGQG